MSTTRKGTTSGSATPMVMAGTTMVAHSRRLCRTVHGENVSCHCWTICNPASYHRSYARETEDVVCNYGIPERLVSVNGTYFTSSKFRTFARVKT